MARKKTVPKEFKELKKQRTKKDVDEALRKMKRRNKVWYTLAILALGGAGWAVARWYSQSFDLSGIGEATIDHLKYLGQSIAYPKTEFTSARFNYLQEQETVLAEKVRAGSMSVTEAIGKLKGMLRATDPSDVKEALIKDFGMKIREKWSFPMPAYWRPMVTKMITGRHAIDVLKETYKKKYE